jgi:O-succinylbenzoate synthase
MPSVSSVGDAVIRGARVYQVALPLRVPFAISGGVMRVRRSLIVELVDDSGVSGFGESAPFEFPFYSSETVSSALSCLEDVLLPRLVGETVGDSESLWQMLRHGVRGNRMARAGVDTAWWSLAARREGTALAELVTRRLSELGVTGDALRRSGDVPCGVAIGIPEGEDLTTLERDVRAAVQRGYRRVKLKIRPGWDRDPVNAARSILRQEGVDLPLWADANGAYDRTRHRPDLEVLDDLGLLFIEQPFGEEALWDAAVHNRASRTPVCLDESLVSDDVARQVIEMGGPTIWNLKVQRLGGLEEACRVYARGTAAGAQLWVGTMPETGVGAQAALALAAHGGCVYPTDVEPSERWYEPGADLLDLTMSPGGTMQVPDRAPDEPDRNRLELLLDLRA